MKIAVLIPSLARKGPVILVQQLVKSLVQTHDVEVFYFDDITELEFECKATRISFFNAYDFSGFDLIHTHMLRCDIYYFLHKRKIRIPAVTTVHQYIRDTLRSNYHSLLAEATSLVWKKLLKKHDAVVCINRHMAEYYRGMKLNKNITTIYNGVDVKEAGIERDDEKRMLELKSRYRLIMSIASINSQKGLGQLLPFLQQNPDYAYIVLGKGPEMDVLTKQAEDLELGERFVLLGFRENATSFLRYADVYIMPSISEGFGLALVEAAAFGKALVCSDIPSFREMFTENEAIFFTLHDRESLTSAIKYAFDHKAVLGPRALAKYRSRYTSEIMAENYIRLYKELLNK